MYSLKTIGGVSQLSDVRPQTTDTGAVEIQKYSLSEISSAVNLRRAHAAGASPAPATCGRDMDRGEVCVSFVEFE